jgi:hypothetical protein
MTGDNSNGRSMLGRIVVIYCPMERCPGLRLADDLPAGEIVGQACDHLERHHIHGQALIKQVSELRIDGDRPRRELLRNMPWASAMRRSWSISPAPGVDPVIICSQTPEG